MLTSLPKEELDRSYREETRKYTEVLANKVLTLTLKGNRELINLIFDPVNEKAKPKSDSENENQ